jgi:phage host-nuclease inhibitor protein Gam
MNMLKAQIEAAVVAQILEALREEGDDAVQFAIREGTTYEDFLTQLVDYQADAASMVEAISERQKNLADRKSRFNGRIDKARDALADLLRGANLRKYEMPECTLSLGHTPSSLRILDESSIPEAFIRIKSEPDRAAIKDALKKGEIVPGAELSNGGETLIIRRK